MTPILGQKQNIKTILTWRLKKSTPRFLILAGEGDRDSLASYIADTINATTVTIGKSVDEVRSIIELSYTNTTTTVYFFKDGDSMSNAALNAILKIVEEPPNNSYFIIGCESIDNLLDTIKGRATTLRMQPYLKAELGLMTDDELVLQYCTHPEEVTAAVNNNEDFKKLVAAARLVSSLITTKKSSGVTLLRQLQLDNIPGKDVFSPCLLLRMCEKMINLEENGKWTFESALAAIRLTNDSRAKLKNNSLNKQSILDNWALSIRRIHGGG